MSQLRDILALNLKALRKLKGWNQDDLAERSGMSLDTIRNIEGKRTWVSSDTAAALAASLGVPASSLFAASPIALGIADPSPGALEPFQRPILPISVFAEVIEEAIEAPESHIPPEMRGRLTLSLLAALGDPEKTAKLEERLNRKRALRGEPKLNQAAILASTLSNANRLSDLEAKSAKPSTDKPTPSHASLLGEAVAILAGLNESELRTVMPFIQNAQSMSAKRSGSGQRKKLADDQG